MLAANNFNRCFRVYIDYARIVVFIAMLRCKIGQKIIFAQCAGANAVTTIRATLPVHVIGHLLNKNLFVCRAPERNFAFAAVKRRPGIRMVVVNCSVLGIARVVEVGALRNKCVKGELMGLIGTCHACFVAEGP